jgi:hypothetical protein
VNIPFAIDGQSPIQSAGETDERMAGDLGGPHIGGTPREAPVTSGGGRASAKEN